MSFSANAGKHFSMVTDFKTVIWHNLVQKPIFDRIFYVPFWECPYDCDFCCVDSLPGKPQEESENALEHAIEVAREIKKVSGKKIGFHLYGGEPMLRPNRVSKIIDQVLAHKETFKKVYLYSTLKPKKSSQYLSKYSENELRIVVNDFTADQNTISNMKKLSQKAEFYDNPVSFHTGRARNAEERKVTFFEKYFPRNAPGRSCFANASGPLFNATHNTIHLCCLPQSPIISHVSSSPQDTLKNYQKGLAKFYKDINIIMKKEGLSHACMACEKMACWDTRKQPSFTI